MMMCLSLNIGLALSIVATHVAVLLIVGNIPASKNVMSNQLIRSIALDRPTSSRIVLAGGYHSYNLPLRVEQSAQILYLTAMSVAERHSLAVMLMNNFAIQVVAQHV
jgi:hypothetical protein